MVPGLLRLNLRRRQSILIHIDRKSVRPQAQLGAPQEYVLVSTPPCGIQMQRRTPPISFTKKKLFRLRVIATLFTGLTTLQVTSSKRNGGIVTPNQPCIWLPPASRG